MRVRIQCNFALLLAFAVVSTASAAAQTASQIAVQPAATSEKPLRAELALEYSYLRSNAPPGGCGCFNLNGGSATFAWTLRPGGAFALVGDVTAAHQGSISTSGYSLTLSSYTAGARYRLKLRQPSWQPFGQVLIGLARSSGSLVQGQNSATSNAGAAFAANLGGGLDLRANRRFSFRLVEADYLVTTFNNGTNDHQNNLRLSTGVVVRF
jgi:peptidoglycan-associated lipoprotein